METSYRELDGDLIKLAKDGEFEVIDHGCNCMSVMKSGIAPQMVKAFKCDKFPMESVGADITKLGNIDFGFNVKSNVTIVNAYTQYGYGRNKVHLDYEALTLCLRKMNVVFKGQHIGLPKLGAGLAGGDWTRIKEIIKTELKDCNVTVVNYIP